LIRTLDNLGFSQRQRLTFIESVAYWEGAVDRPRVSRVFNVSGNHVTKDFRLYKDTFPGNIKYDERSRVYRPLPTFKPRIGKGSAEEYLALHRTFTDGDKSATVPAMAGMVAADAVPQPKGKLESAVLNTITRAISSRTGLAVTYQSLRNGKPRERRIWPHALVFGGTRWHARVFDESEAKFIDLVLQRFIRAKPIEMSAPVEVDQDVEWNTFVSLDARPNRAFTPSQAEVVAQEFGMKQVGRQWIWQVRLRQCLAQYFIYLYRLDLADDPRRLIELADKRAIERYGLGTRGKVAKSAKGTG
jgi:hypothetical protein